MLKSPWIAMVLSLGIALLWLRINDYIAHKGWVDSKLSRKIIHIGTGPIFVLCWLLFPDVRISRYLAALIPAGISLQFAAVALGIIEDQAAVDAMSRTGDRREILKGPLFYGLVFVALTLVFWNRSEIGIVALMMLCGGDGLADVVGTRVKSPSLTWSKTKTLAGSVGVMLGGTLFSILVLSVYIANDVFPGPLSGYYLPIAIIGFAAALVESLPLKDLDNITVPLSVVVLGSLLF